MRLKEAIQGKDVGFDINHCRESVSQNLKTVEEVTDKLMVSSERGKLEGIGKRYLDILRDVEFQLDSFDMLVSIRSTITKEL